MTQSSKSTPKLTLVVAVAKNGIIGAGGTLPWKLSSDMARFKAATMGKPILMGRKTWDSLPRKPLSGRPNIIVSRDPNFRAEGAWAYADIEAALAAARAMAEQANAEEICVIGGAQLYAATLARADRIRLTEIDLEPEGDARFPALNPAEWTEIERETVPAGPKDESGFVVRVLARR